MRYIYVTADTINSLKFSTVQEKIILMIPKKMLICLTSLELKFSHKIIKRVQTLLFNIDRNNISKFHLLLSISSKLAIYWELKKRENFYGDERADNEDPVRRNFLKISTIFSTESLTFYFVMGFVNCLQEKKIDVL